jgi:peptide/nickel transport system permease protein
MIAYLARRIVQSLLILLGVSVITFALLYLLPADPVRQIAGRSATPLAPTPMLSDVRPP